MKKFKAICESVSYIFIFSFTTIICALIISFIYVCFSKINLNLPQMSTYVMEIIACSLIMIIFYFILKVKRHNFVDSIKLNKITLHSALPFILLGLSVYFIFIFHNKNKLWLYYQPIFIYIFNLLSQTVEICLNFLVDKT